jgi:large subunit ribosomal protein L9
VRERIEALTYEQRRAASEEGKLFGSVTSQDVVGFLEAHQIAVERRRVMLDEPIKTLGEHTVTIRLHTDVTAQLKISVQREE